MTDQAILEKLINADKKTKRRLYKDLYINYEEAFYAFIHKHFSLNDDQIKKLYTEAWFGFSENIYERRLTELTASLKTYLFQLGRNQALNLLKRLGRLKDKTYEKNISELEDIGTLYKNTTEQDVSGFKSFFNPWDDDERLRNLEGEDDLNEKRNNLVKEVVDRMTKVCRSILKPFYYENKKLDEIFNSLPNFTTKNALKTKKYKCMKSLENMLREQFLIEGLL